MNIIIFISYSAICCNCHYSMSCIRRHLKLLPTLS